MLRASIYRGTVGHIRLHPKSHKLRYRVFSFLLDADTIHKTARTAHLFSYNRFNVFSFYDSDHKPEGFSSVADYVRQQLRQAGLGDHSHRISVLCYPRLFGYVFNPLTVYFCYDKNQKLGAIIYKVTNTFREQRSYVIPVGEDPDDLIKQNCSKELYVSPFNEQEGTYAFTVSPPADRVSIAIAYSHNNRDVLKTYFKGDAFEFSDRELLKLLFTYPLMTFKVTAGIHMEALWLWLKGLKVHKHRRVKKFSVSIVAEGKDQGVG